MIITKGSAREEIKAIASSAEQYFEECCIAVGDNPEDPLGPAWGHGAEYYWFHIPDPLKAKAEELRSRIIPISQDILRLCRRSPLVNDADVSEVQRIAKRSLALLRLREYFYSAPEVIHDGGVVLGFQPGSQEEREARDPRQAGRSFAKTMENLCRILDLTEDVSADTENKDGSSSFGAYRRNSAFVMMWMDATKPDLDDVRDAVVATFRTFDIMAVRADDIEHEGVITQRVLAEIRTAEFLFADLSGSRPNVYYEVGYAHALGKRVILFRKGGTGMHFDLAGYNCPEYVNIRDLTKKLTKRLEVLTNKTAGRLSDES